MTDKRPRTTDYTTSLKSADVFPVVVKPVWEPFGDEAEEVVANLIEEAQWPSTGPKAIRYRVMVASFLKAVQEVYSRHIHSRNDNKDTPY